MSDFDKTSWTADDHRWHDAIKDKDVNALWKMLSNPNIRSSTVGVLTSVVVAIRLERIEKILDRIEIEPEYNLSAKEE